MTCQDHTVSQRQSQHQDVNSMSSQIPSSPPPRSTTSVNEKGSNERWLNVCISRWTGEWADQSMGKETARFPTLAPARCFHKLPHQTTVINLQGCMMTAPSLPNMKKLNVIHLMLNIGKVTRGLKRMLGRVPYSCWMKDFKVPFLILRKESICGQYGFLRRRSRQASVILFFDWVLNRYVREIQWAKYSWISTELLTRLFKISLWIKWRRVVYIMNYVNWKPVKIHPECSVSILGSKGAFWLLNLNEGSDCVILAWFVNNKKLVKTTIKLV